MCVEEERDEPDRRPEPNRRDLSGDGQRAATGSSKAAQHAYRNRRRLTNASPPSDAFRSQRLFIQLGGRRRVMLLKERAGGALGCCSAAAKSVQWRRIVCAQSAAVAAGRAVRSGAGVGRVLGASRAFVGVPNGSGSLPRRSSARVRPGIAGGRSACADLGARPTGRTDGRTARSRRVSVPPPDRSTDRATAGWPTGGGWLPGGCQSSDALRPPFAAAMPRRIKNNS